MATSPRLSFKGYAFGVALYRNKDAIKNIVAVLGTYSTYLGVTGFDWIAFLLALGGAVLVLGYKLLQDAVDYYFTEVEI
jgi:hypothetical protein